MNRQPLELELTQEDADTYDWLVEGLELTRTTDDGYVALDLGLVTMACLLFMDSKQFEHRRDSRRIRSFANRRLIEQGLNTAAIRKHWEDYTRMHRAARRKQR